MATVAGPALTLSEGWLPKVLAALALIFLLGGVLAARYLGRWGRPLTLVTFLGSCTACWLSLGDALDITRLEPIRAAFGGVGWMLFAFSWGAVREPRAVPEEDPNVIVGVPLTPRVTSRPLSVAAMAIALIGASVPWALAWRVSRPEHAVFAHAVALGCGVAMLSVGARISTLLGKKRVEPSPRLRLQAASSALGVSVLLVMLGVVVWMW